jgi:REP element-mobilizing transposase RayT
MNVRSNHIHAVVSAKCEPEKVLAVLKANSTRKRREAGCWHRSGSPWAELGSKKYLWTEKQLNNAIAYVQYDQGEPLC